MCVCDRLDILGVGGSRGISSESESAGVVSKLDHSYGC